MGIGWLPLAIISYLMLGIAGVVDRAIVHKEVTKPIVISFWVALFTIFTILILLIGYLPVPFAEDFKFQTPSQEIFGLILFAGVLNQLGLLFMYRGLHDGEATRVLSVMGAVIPITTLLLAYLWLDERISTEAFGAFVVLIVGTVALTANFSGKKSVNYKWFGNALFASIILAAQSVIAKHIFDEFHFISAFALMSLGALLYVATIMAFSKDVQREVQIIFGVGGHKPKATKKEKQSNKQIIWIIGNSALGGVAVILLNLAIKLGSPTLVNALRGIQYAVVFMIAIFLAKKIPELLDEDLSKNSVIQKVVGIILISVGVAILAVNT